jgi:hypothetical protein
MKYKFSVKTISFWNEQINELIDYWCLAPFHKTKLPNSEQSYKGKVKTRKYINGQNQSTTGKLKTVMTLTWYRQF